MLCPGRYPAQCMEKSQEVALQSERDLVFFMIYCNLNCAGNKMGVSDLTEDPPDRDLRGRESNLGNCGFASLLTIISKKTVNVNPVV